MKKSSFFLALILVLAVNTASAEDKPFNLSCSAAKVAEFLGVGFTFEYQMCIHTNLKRRLVPNKQAAKSACYFWKKKAEKCGIIIEDN